MGEDVTQIGFRIETVEFCGFDQREYGGGAFSAFVRSSEQPVLSAERDWPDGAFGGIVVDLNAAVINEATEGCPTGSA